MIRNGEASLDASAARLIRAIEALEARLANARSAGAALASPRPADTGETGALHAQLREVLLRERALEAAAAEASTVLGRAADQIRAALSEEDIDEEPGDDPDEAGAALGPSLLDELSDEQTDLHPTAAREF